MGYTPSFTPQYEDGWEDLPLETTPIQASALNGYDDAIENIENYLASDESQANLADAYDETATYDLGDYVIYGGDLYKCTTAISTAEEWDSTKWESCLITDEMGSGGGGTTVIANPSGEATDDLEKVQIGSTIYDVGSGNTNMWTGTQAEYETQASQIANGTLVNITDDEEQTQALEIYDSNERVCGEYFGEKLYKRTIQVTGLSKATSSTVCVSASDMTTYGIDASNIKKLDFAMNYSVSGASNMFTQNTYLNSSNLILVWLASGAVYYQAQWGSASSVDISIDVTIEYTKTV